MLNPAHIVEVALLLLVAFLIGASLGTLARFAAMAVFKPKVVAAPVAAAAPAADATAVVPVTAAVAETRTDAAAPPSESVVTAAVPTIETSPVATGEASTPPVETVVVEAPAPVAELAPEQAIAAAPEMMVVDPSPLTATEAAPEPVSIEVTAAPPAPAIEEAAAPTPVDVAPVIAADAPVVKAEPGPVLVGSPDFAEALMALVDEAEKAATAGMLDDLTRIAAPPAAATAEVAPPVAADAQIAPAPVAGEAISPVLDEAEPAPVAVHSAEIIPIRPDLVAVVEPEPVVLADPELELEAVPATAQGEPQLVDVTEVPEPAAPVVPEIELPVEEAAEKRAELRDDEPDLNAVPDALLAAIELDSEDDETPERIEPEIVPVSEPAAAAPPPEADVQPEPPKPAANGKVSSAEDEAAAMRAIEGNWTPRRTPRAAAKAPGLDEADEAVAGSREAVAAAVAAARAVAGQPGRPAGIDAPRNGRKDRLTYIIGVLPIIETALNNLGIYHYSQVGELTDENVGWLEAHLGIEGRIGREHWREQARAMAEVAAGQKVASDR